MMENEKSALNKNSEMPIDLGNLSDNGPQTFENPKVDDGNSSVELDEARRKIDTAYQENPAIKGVSSFENLFEVIEEQGGVTGSDGRKYTVGMIKELVGEIIGLMGRVAPEARDKRNFTDDNVWMKNFTRREGLRDKIRELFLRMYWPEDGGDLEGSSEPPKAIKKESWLGRLLGR